MRYWLRDGSELAASGNTAEQAAKALDLEDDKASEADIQAYEGVQGEASAADGQGREEE